MAVQARETEIKYEATVGAALPSFDVLPQVARTRSAASEQLDAEYFDTDDLRLIRAGITLRRRRGGHDAGWHLKLPAGPHTRRELRLPLGRSRSRVPDELARLVRVHTRGAELKPVARISTLRQRQLLLDSAGESLAEVASDDVTAQTLGGATRVSQWHEVEVELTGGKPDVLAAADKLLRGDGLNRSGQSAKLARALGLPPPQPAEQRPAAGRRQPARYCWPISERRSRCSRRSTRWCAVTSPTRCTSCGPRSGGCAARCRSSRGSSPIQGAIRWPPSCGGSARCWARRAMPRYSPGIWLSTSASYLRRWWSARSWTGCAGTSPASAPMPRPACWRHSTHPGTSPCLTSSTS